MPYIAPPTALRPTAQLVAARACFLAALPDGAHLLHAHGSVDDTLDYLRQQGHVVTACEPNLALAKIASGRYSQPVRICHVTDFHSVLPYDGIWLAEVQPHPRDAALAQLLQHLGGLLKKAAWLYCAVQVQPERVPSAGPQSASAIIPAQRSFTDFLLQHTPFQLAHSWLAPSHQQGEPQILHCVLQRVAMT
ncbi:SAM-dependent methyltransferase [Aeromonas cavernicola]|uniref:SAM-dependent methyltransferase n=1 Tax=Aeromonas cavernicola TaxID=1006623 RepID=A0A2H9U807_9GAMM|nr:SAM-dependent methyltransferase [Aeromonas cavernicola]PJG60176.1 SAM-dependent methyltransferase [Aeromonas cavernicola]